MALADNIDVFSPLLTPGQRVQIAAAVADVEISVAPPGGVAGAIPNLKQIVLFCSTAGTTVGTMMLGEGPAGGGYTDLVRIEIDAFALNTVRVFTFPKGWNGRNGGVFRLRPSVATLGVWQCTVNGFIR